MRKTGLLLILAALVFPVASLSAYDQIWGGRLNLNLELPEFYGTSAAITMENNAGFWYRGSWGSKANLEVDAGLGFDYDFIFGITNDMNFSWHGFGYSYFPVFDSLKFYGRSGLFGYSAGRQVFADPAGLILGAPADGIDASMELGGHVFGAGLAYTGLTFRQSSEYYVNSLDLGDEVLSQGRMIEYLSWDFPAAAEWLNLSAFFLAAQDLTGSDEEFSPMYLEIMMRGFLGQSFLYDLSLVGQYGTGDFTTLAGIGRLGFSWLPGSSSRLGMDLMSSTGDTWTDRNEYLLSNTAASTELNQYIPLSIVSTQGYVIEFEVGNLTSLGLFYARKPRDNHSWEIRTTTFLRTAEGPVSTGLVSSSSSSGNFLGQEALFSWFWRPRSDFGWDLKLGMMYVGDNIQLDTYLQDFYLDTVPLMFRMGFDWSWSF